MIELAKLFSIMIEYYKEFVGFSRRQIARCAVERAHDIIEGSLEHES